MKLFLGGDLMVGRGVDQILPHPGDPTLYEPWVSDARDYVALAERKSGPIPRPVDPSYPWGEALAALDAEAPDVRIANLETSITDRGAPEAGKHVHYRVTPRNAEVLAAGRLDGCALANNHLLDWGPTGLSDTLSVLEALGIRGAGAGERIEGAQAAAAIPCGEAGRIRLISVATGSSGVPERWEASLDRPGIWRIPDLSEDTAARVADRAVRDRSEGDVVVASIHWGPNWGWRASSDEVRFARRLIREGVDLIHGHSSHHPRPAEIHRGRLVLYGCGELLDDYEGIRGHQAFRPDLVLLWLPTLERSGALSSLRAIPMQIRRLRLQRPEPEDRAWLAATLARICRPFGLGVRPDADDALILS